MHYPRRKLLAEATEEEIRIVSSSVSADPRHYGPTLSMMYDIREWGFTIGFGKYDYDKLWVLHCHILCFKIALSWPLR